MKRYRVFTEVIMSVEREVDADSFDEARSKTAEIPLSREDILNGNNVESHIVSAEDISTGEYAEWHRGNMVLWRASLSDYMGSSGGACGTAIRHHPEATADKPESEVRHGT